MKPAYLLFFLIIVTTKVQSQDRSNFKPNAVYLELFGNGILYSFNYDRVISSNGKLKFSTRVGFSYVDIDLFDDIRGAVIPIEFLGWIGNKGHLEFGTGLSSQFVQINDVSILGQPEEYSSNAFYLTGRLGYRLQKPDGGFLFRIGFVPMILLSESTTSNNPNERSEFVPWFGLSFGYSF